VSLSQWASHLTNGITLLCDHNMLSFLVVPFAHRSSVSTVIHSQLGKHGPVAVLEHLNLNGWIYSAVPSVLSNGRY
jgi:hypothetical protein